MKFFTFLFLSLSPFLANAALNDISESYLVCVHVYEDDFGQETAETKTTALTADTESYSADSSMTVQTAKGRATNNITFHYSIEENSYSYNFSTVSYDLNDFPIEASAERKKLNENRVAEFAYESARLGRKFSANCSIIKL